jgi:hypothetical protein
MLLRGLRVELHSGGPHGEVGKTFFIKAAAAVFLRAVSATGGRGVVVRGIVVMPVSEPLPEIGNNSAALSRPTAVAGMHLARCTRLGSRLLVSYRFGKAVL